MPNYFLCAVCALFLAACQPASPVRPDFSQPDAALALDTFSRIPTAFAHCGCAVATSDFALGERQFVLVHGETEAMAVVDGREIHLALADDRSTEQAIHKVFAGEGYRAVLFLQKNAAAPLPRFEGVLELKNHASTVKYDIVGSCGCH